MADLESLARWLTQGSRALGEGARGEARRVLDVLVDRGDLSRDEADEIEAAVAQAADGHRRWLDERVLAPLRAAFGGTQRDALEARLAALEERLARIEAALARREGGA
jgi:polyhydroxyalkanoate synthesis regulator phasin